MEAEIVSKTLTPEEVLEKIKDFYLKICTVNSLCEKYLGSKEKKDKDIFQSEWKKLYDEKSQYFTALSFEDIGWPHKKSILLDNSVNINLLRMENARPDESPIKKTATNVKIAYTIADNQDDFTPESGFPYFGLYVVLVLDDGSKNIISIAIAKTEKGCNLIMPKFDTENLTITGGETKIQFEKVTDFVTIAKLCKNNISLVNNTISESALNQNFKEF
ncbi:MAG: hypothetical protein WAW11_04145 [Patescibacteria group bacterium]